MPISLGDYQRIAEAEEFAMFGARNARVGGEAVKMIEALGQRPGGKCGASQFAEKF